MYYIAYFLELKKNIIVPKQWIKDIKLHKEKFYNNSLNRTQTFTCYYTNDRNAFDDDDFPKGNFPANFQAGFRSDLNDEGLFRVKLKYYTCSKESAMDYVRCHRNIVPGLYNEDRLGEEPIPNTDASDDENHIPNESVDRDSEPASEDGENDADQSGRTDPVEEIIIIHPTNTASEADQLSSNDQSQAESNNASISDTHGKSTYQIVVT